MKTLACIKRVPDTGASIVLTEDRQEIDASNLGYTMSPHEECAIEEAVQLAEDHAGSATVLTLGSEAAIEQLRTGLAMRANDAILLETDGEEWPPAATAAAIADGIQTIEAEEDPFDVLLFGNESADQENYQVGVRVAHALGRPCVAGVKEITIEGNTLTAHHEVPGGAEVYELDMPAVLTVKEGLNSPRYPSMRSKMQARRQEVRRLEPISASGGLERIELITPETDDAPADILGEGVDAAPDVVDILDDLGVL